MRAQNHFALRPSLRLIGLAHRFQQVAGLDEQSWDVPLSGILTDSGWIDVG